MLKFKYFLIESPTSGSLTDARGKLHEIAFHHVFSKYHDLLNQSKHKDPQEAHEAALNQIHDELFNKGPTINADHNHEGIDSIRDRIGHVETDRTLRDSFHSALETINHIHHESGGITGPSVSTGGDRTGRKAEEITGEKTPADLVVPTRSGWYHLSLKHSGSEEGKGNTKLSQPTARQVVEHVQEAHIKNFGKRDSELDSRLEEMEKGFSSPGIDSPEHKKTLEAAGFKEVNGKLPLTKIKKLGRYASYVGTGKDTEKRMAELHAHFDEANIGPEERQEHIKKLADIYQNTIRSNKRTSAAEFMNAFHNSLKRVYTEGESGQHQLIKNMLNINAPKTGKFMLIKTQRSRGNQPPSTYLINHNKNLDDYLENSGRHESKLYDGKRNEKRPTVTNTIAAHNGDVITRAAIDIGKSSPSVIFNAGDAVDKGKKLKPVEYSRKRPINA